MTSLDKMDATKIIKKKKVECCDLKICLAYLEKEYGLIQKPNNYKFDNLNSFFLSQQEHQLLFTFCQIYKYLQFHQMPLSFVSYREIYKLFILDNMHFYDFFNCVISFNFFKCFKVDSCFYIVPVNTNISKIHSSFINCYKFIWDPCKEEKEEFCNAFLYLDKIYTKYKFDMLKILKNNKCLSSFKDGYILAVITFCIHKKILYFSKKKRINQRLFFLKYHLWYFFFENKKQIIKIKSLKFKDVQTKHLKWVSKAKLKLTDKHKHGKFIVIENEKLVTSKQQSLDILYKHLYKVLVQS